MATKLRIMAFVIVGYLVFINNSKKNYSISLIVIIVTVFVFVGLITPIEKINQRIMIFLNLIILMDSNFRYSWQYSKFIICFTLRNF
jgi:hypothetical protein